MAVPRASCAPRAMAVAALPTAASHTGPASGAARSACATQLRPFTRASPVCHRPSNSSRRGSMASAGSAPAHDLEQAAALAAGELGGVGTLELQPLEILGGDIAGHVHT